MSTNGADLRVLAERLSQLASRLGAEETAEEDVVKLAQEAAELSAEAGHTIDAALGELAERGRADQAPDLGLDAT